MKLGRLEPVTLREAWAHEASNFTPWLAREENLSILAEALGTELELIRVEEDVGSFNADILCKDTVDGHNVVIENQLSDTDHSHLGQLLTYAAGLDAVTIVWVCARLREEHRAALDWLNDVTNDQARFFGIEVELWRIGESPAAPRFNVVSRPNDWAKSTKAKGAKDLSPANELQLRYWESLREHFANAEHAIRPRKALPQHWMDFPIGRTGFRLSAALSVRDGLIRSELVINHGQAERAYALLQEHQEEIEADFGEELEWYEREGVHHRRIFVQKDADPNDEGDWDEQFQWFSDMLARFDATFRPRIKALDLDAQEGG